MFLLFFVHLYFLNRYAINIPFSDDYVEILKNMNLVLDSGSFSESTRHILHGNGFSKPITLRLISLLHISVLHEINFKYLVITGNIFLLFVCFIFIISAININKYIAVTASCFIFQPQYWEAIYQSTLSNSVFSCLFFSLASIYCIMQKRTLFFAGALAFAILAQISFGNGFLVYPILLMVAIIHKRFRHFAVIFVLMLLSTYLYMLGNTVPYTAGDNLGLLAKLKLCSVWLVEFIGSSVGYAFSSGYGRDMAGRTSSIMIGVLIIAFYLFLIWRKYYNKNLLLFSFLTFFILTALLAAKLRFNTEVPGASRYQIQSALCLLTTLIIIIDLYGVKMNRYIVIMLTIAFPIMFVLITYNTNLSTVSGHKTRLISGLISWMMYGKGLTVWSEEEAAGRLLIQSNNRDLYKVPTRQTLYLEVWKH